MGNPARPLESIPAPGPGPVPVISPERELPPPREARGNATLNHAAERLGEMAELTAEKAQDLPRRLTELRECFIVIQGRKKEDAAIAAADWQQKARQNFHYARNRAEILANEYPLEVILGTAAAAFVIGFALRIWRSHHAGD